jgi:tetratricopeptide (TPR) repeat protein
MKFLKMIPIIFIFLGLPSYMNLSYAESKNTNEYKVLSNTNKKLSISDVKDYLAEGDNLVKNGDFEKAKQSYDKARNLARQLAGFYRDLNGSFKGLDARVPLEMEKKGRKSIKIWAQSNARLASLYKRKKQPEVAVPLLVEIIRLMTPNSTEGKEAYENLLQLGFVETDYKGF